MIHVGDCLDVMRTLDQNSVDAVICDPPYGLGFMGKAWDHGVPGEPFWREALRVAKPGAHLLAFGGTRTFHRLACAIEDAGWELRDTLMWVYGSGFPKSLDVSKAIDKDNGRKFEDRFALGRHIRKCREALGLSAAEVNSWFGYSDGCQHWERQDRSGARVPTLADWRILRERLSLSDEHLALVERLEAEREMVGSGFSGKTYGMGGLRGVETSSGEFDITAPATEAARQWQGWGTALKPSWEPIIMARKSLIGTVAANVQAHGTGALNIDGCRIAETGRWPANLIHDGSDEVMALFPNISSPQQYVKKKAGWLTPGSEHVENELQSREYGDTGSAARFFYCPKADREDRNDGCDGMPERPLLWSSGAQSPGTFQAEGTRRASENNHPTVKPTDLMRWLCRLVTPPGGLVLDPFAGSGSTGRGAIAEGMLFVGIELDPDYAAIAEARIRAIQPGLSLSGVA